MGRHWRLIPDRNRNAALNMAIDEAMLRACADGKSPPTLRLYGWERPAISLGYFQSVERTRIDTQYCRDAGIELVRRLTGGRAVLHGHDLTFSIAIRQGEIPDGFKSVISSHAWLMGGILAGLRLLGVEAEIGPADHGRSRSGESADCFAHVAQCDIRVGAEKAAGAAQVRKWGALLEQGSIPCALPRVDYGRVFGGGDSGLQTERLAALEVSRERLEEAVIRGFQEFLDVDLEPATLSRSELELATELEKNKYAADEWTYRALTSVSVTAILMG